MKIRSITPRLYKTPIRENSNLPKFNDKQNEVVSNSSYEQLRTYPHLNIINFKGNEVAKDKNDDTIFTEISNKLRYIGKYADESDLENFNFFLNYPEKYKDKAIDYKTIFMSENNTVIQKLIDKVGTEAIDNDVLEEQAKNANLSFFEILKEKMLNDKKIADKYPDFETYYFIAKANKFHSIDGKFALTYPKQNDFDIAGLANYFCTHINKHINCSACFRIPAKNVVTTQVGMMLHWEDKKFLEKLKDFGVQTIINVAKDDEEYEQKCKDAGLEYFNISLPSLNYDSNTRKIAQKCAENPEFINKLKKLFEIINSKNVIMGCQLGYIRTPLAIYLNYYLNKTQQKPTLELAHTYENMSKHYYSKFVKEFFDYLTETQKKELGLQDTDIDKIPAIDAPNSYKQYNL